ncbi:MAG: EAL domain-containing protein [Rhodocyclaceae bacterium]
MPAFGLPSLDVSGSIDHILRAVRQHLGMDVAFVSEFTGNERIFRHVDAAGWTPIYMGDSIPMDVGYCKRVVDGRLPRLIPDTTQEPEAMALPETTSIPIGSHLSVPIRLSDGRIYGTFCCFGFHPDNSLNQRDLGMMEAFAGLVAYQIDLELLSQNERSAKFARIEAALAHGGPEIVFQPICRLSDERFVGMECLSRFPNSHGHTPDKWFAEAAEVGLGPALEVSAMRNALRALTLMPEDTYLAINASPETVMSRNFDAIFAGVDTERIVLELTEHAHVDDYDALRRSLSSLRSRGVKVSIDDAGAGYASMRHILNLQPEIIKLDISLTRAIDRDRSRCALASALVEFGKQTGSSILAEGVETASELDLLRKLGADKAQGYFLSRPLPLEDALRFMTH